MTRTISEINAKLDDLLICAQAEEADVDLFAPLPPKEDCPICYLPFPLRESESTFNVCCGKIICVGCHITNKMTMEENGFEDTCAFYRQPRPDPIDNIKALNQLMQKNNTDAFMAMAHRYQTGDGVSQSNMKALELFIRASDLGSAVVYGFIAVHYEHGYVVEKDGSKHRAFLEISAKRGSISCRRRLAKIEEENGNIDLAIKHWTVAANAGFQESLDELMRAFRDNIFAKEDLLQTLREFQASNDEMKSKARDDYVRWVKQN
eukprot:CAMPEP_0201909324 /NCGR_PEP_ID=MMETSP0903-20130614/1136_1 /ASSEMBLY_ACC=CAM_ASM_000552 /TAXON_ID=420261 /ORGANISM="Thalassiosira antarctica, Strain CCMP982" /LENGTH=262 /DNA_ID=CAMNT_0048443833 /DNA_START=85 /DNA_END=870 /DNA_ORIENTATION=-